MVSQTQSTEARRAERRSTAAPSTLRADSIGPTDATVLDVSTSGAKIQCGADLRVGQEVSVGLANVGAMRGLVMWRRDDCYGIAFAQPLADDVAARAFSEQTVVQLVGRKSVAGVKVVGTAGEEDIDQDLYAEGTGWLSALVVTVIFVAIAAAWLFRTFGWS